LEVQKKDCYKKKENIRWNQIMRYFEKLEQYKEEKKVEEDPSKL